MPKPLTKSQPSSSVSNILDMAVGAAALGVPQKAETTKLTPVADSITPQPLPSEPTGEPANIHRQFILTSAADETLKKIIHIYSQATGLDIKASELLRAILVALEHAAPELEREAARVGRLKRPKNERGNEALRDQLEHRLARAIVAGTRAAGVLK